MMHHIAADKLRMAVAAAAGLVLLPGCDDTASQVLDTIFFAFEIVSVWL